MLSDWALLVFWPLSESIVAFYGRVGVEVFSTVTIPPFRPTRFDTLKSALTRFDTLALTTWSVLRLRTFFAPGPKFSFLTRLLDKFVYNPPLRGEGISATTDI